ncbi:hypothetical protein AX16_003953 [Volvariella volvacea WC 439]|nr:hypothetical protein AX16_003953 [Volvariella volvacea WC 439]
MVNTSVSFSYNFYQVLSSLPPREYLPIPVVKRVLRHVLLGIAHIHEHKIAHTDIKPDNITISPHDLPRSHIEEWPKNNPPMLYPPVQSKHGNVSTFVTTNFPVPAQEDLLQHDFVLSDFSNSQFIDNQSTDDITPLGLRPPEIILGGEWDESVDIWTFGCLVFTLVTRIPLFEPVPRPEQIPASIDFLLFQMVIFCGEHFPAELLSRCPYSHEYFEHNCRLNKIRFFPRITFEQSIRNSGARYPDSDIKGAASFMTRCLRILPSDRPSAHRTSSHSVLRREDLPLRIKKLKRYSQDYVRAVIKELSPLPSFGN